MIWFLSLVKTGCGKLGKLIIHLTSILVSRVEELCCFFLILKVVCAGYIKQKLSQSRVLRKTWRTWSKEFHFAQLISPCVIMR